MASSSAPVHPYRYLALFLALLVGVYLLVFLTGDKQVKPKLGIDLQGGTRVTLTARTPDGSKPTRDALNQAQQIISSRVNGLGVSGSEVVIDGDNLVITVPGNDGNEARNLGQTARLFIRPVIGQPIPVEAVNKKIAEGKGGPGGAPPSGAPGAPAAPVPPGESPQSAPPGGSPQPAPPAESPQPAPSSPAPQPRPYPLEPPPSPPPPAPRRSRDAAPVVRTASESGPGAPGQPTPPGPPDPRQDLAARIQVRKGTPPEQESDPSHLRGAVRSRAVRPTRGRTGRQRRPGASVGHLLAGQQIRLHPGQVDHQRRSDQERLLRLRPAEQGLRRRSGIQDEASKTWADFTAANIGTQTAFTLDSQVVSAPQIQEAIPGGRTQISGGDPPFTADSAKTLANVLKYGSLPLSFESSEAETVSATLGPTSLRYGLYAGAIGLALVLVYSLLYYRVLGLLTALSLVASGAMVYGILVLLGRYIGYTLDLAGIAGLIIGIGTTADSFVVFFERIKDEIREGRSFRSAVPRAGRGPAKPFCPATPSVSRPPRCSTSWQWVR